MSYVERYTLLKRAIGHQPEHAGFLRRGRFDRYLEPPREPQPSRALVERPAARTTSLILPPPLVIVCPGADETGRYPYLIDGECCYSRLPGPQQEAHRHLFENAAESLDMNYAFLATLDTPLEEFTADDRAVLRAAVRECIDRSEGRF